MDELEAHGLRPDVLHELFNEEDGKGKERARLREVAAFLKREDAEGRAVRGVRYELAGGQPRLRVLLAQVSPVRAAYVC